MNSSSQRQSNDDIDAILARVRAGDVNAYGSVVRRYQHDVWRVATYALQRREDTEDLVQQAFVIAYQRLDAFEPGRDFGAWVRGIARNLVHDNVRRRVREDRRMGHYLTYLEARAANDDDADAHEERLRQALADCRAALPDPAREALALRYERGQPFERVAETIGRTVAGARQLLQRTRVSLRHCIEGKLA